MSSFLLQSIRNSGGFSRLIFFLLLAVVSIIVSLFIALLVGMLIWGDALMPALSASDFTDTQTITILKYLQSVYTIGFFVIPAFLYAWLFNGNTIVYLGLNRSDTPRNFVLAALVMLAAAPAAAWLYEMSRAIPLPETLTNIIASMEANAERITKAFIAGQSVGSLLVNILLIAVLPAIAEELFFRAGLQQIFQQWFRNPHVAIVLTAFFFSALHLQFYGFFARMLLGVFLGYMFYWSRSLWLPIVAHFINNAFAVTAAWYIQLDTAKEHMVSKLQTLEQGTAQPAFFSVLLISVLLYGLYISHNRVSEQTS